MSNAKQDRAFLDLMQDHISLSLDGNTITVSIDNSSVDDTVEFVKNNFGPDDVFTENELESWALDNEFVKVEKE